MSLTPKFSSFSIHFAHKYMHSEVYTYIQRRNTGKTFFRFCFFLQLMMALAFFACAFYTAPSDKIIFPSIYIFYRLSFLLAFCTHITYVCVCVPIFTKSYLGIFEEIFGFHFWGFFTYFLFLPVFSFEIFIHIYKWHTQAEQEKENEEKSFLYFSVWVFKLTYMSVV